jgi:Cdc6-like AAA superfamily ATPase
MAKKLVRLTESDLHNIIKESVNKVLKEDISLDYKNELKNILNKAFSNLNDNEKIFLSDLLNNETWDVVYTALNILQN